MEIYCSPIISIPKPRFSVRFFCVQLIQTFVYRDDKSGWTRLISTMYFCYFVIICSWKRAGPFIWTNLKTLHPRMHCAKFGWISPSGSEEEFLLYFFCYFVIISHWKRKGPFIRTNLNHIHPKMLCAKFGWNWPSGSGEEENVKSLQRRRQQWWRTMDKVHLSFWWDLHVNEFFQLNWDINKHTT